jgi:hypothetical protein
MKLTHSTTRRSQQSIATEAHTCNILALCSAGCSTSRHQALHPAPFHAGCETLPHAKLARTRIHSLTAGERSPSACWAHRPTYAPTTRARTVSPYRLKLISRLTLLSLESCLQRGSSVFACRWQAVAVQMLPAGSLEASRAFDCSPGVADAPAVMTVLCSRLAQNLVPARHLRSRTTSCPSNAASVEMLSF